MRKAIELFGKVASDSPEKFKEVSKMYGNALRIGMLESQKDKIKLAKLLRFESTRSDYTSLEEVSFQLQRGSILIYQYVDNRKEGQKQVRGSLCSDWTSLTFRSTISPELVKKQRISPDRPLSKSCTREAMRFCCSTCLLMSP